MILTTLDYIRAHTRIDSDFEDTILELYADSAEAQALNYMGRSADDLFASYGGIPAPVVHAVCMLTEHAYRHRNPVSERNMWEVPYTVTARLKPYMIL